MPSRSIELWCPPFRGHLHPMIAMARALQPITDNVRIVSTEAAHQEIQASGLKAEIILQGEDAAIESVANPSRPIRSRPLALFRQFRAALSLLEKLHHAALERYRSSSVKPDLVIVDSVLPTVGTATLLAGLTWWTSTPSPCAIEPLEGTPGYLGGWSHGNTAWLRARDRWGNRCVKLFKRAVHATHRQRLTALGFPRLYRDQSEETIYSSEKILGLGLPEFEFPRRWPRAFTWIGPLLYTPPLSAALPSTNPAWDPQRRNILVTLGTHLPWIKREAAQVIERLSSRFPSLAFHFSEGMPSLKGSTHRGNFHQYPYIPYEPHLPQFDFVVHHGGAGVLYQCLRAGLPCIVIPLDYDQFDHAARIQHSGVGVIARQWRHLGKAVCTITSSPRFGEKSREFQGLLKSRPSDLTLQRVISDFFRTKGVTLP
ncbi:MAG TPA: glycosyltransferase [Opitutaceae bacterium]|nr:glycosyltransferase [Opitutaceae bacterium]